ncbi:cytochrome c4 [Legionella sp. PATHC032]|uniref:c-type cytochrome n=1 Tax=Legionella sp. PATHC032 TaxID=2992039 RepID=UPI001B069B70|nr:c-type cytochrome [Legionella sp. PATHC032]MCW8420140.1 cytochrome c4 [Legionella sp. PATHC032]HAZ7573606.1 cytochrome c4 [Legionella pneumophila]HBA1635328.1 cytochrome c4 [Legionella pneumophila]
MKKLALVLILCSSSVIFAQENPQEAGQSKSTVCIACHGPQGISTNPEWPNLAGQHEKYFVKQLKDIKEGKSRSAPTMTAIIANLTEQDMNDLAAYYAKMPIPEGSTPKKYLKRGEQLYRGGDLNKHIAACIACHGPKGSGNAQAGFPLLSGQHAAYTVMQLQAFKDGKRTNDLNQIMRDISSKMSPEDMEAVAYYIQGLY